jgi:hypothetical protein
MRPSGHKRVARRVSRKSKCKAKDTKQSKWFGAKTTTVSVGIDSQEKNLIKGNGAHHGRQFDKVDDN